MNKQAIKVSATKARWVIAFVLLVTTMAYGQAPKPAPAAKVREIFVPFEDLNVLLEGPDQRVLLTRQEYDDLIAKAKEVKADEKIPRSRVMLSADYDAIVQDGRVTIQGVLTLEVFTEDLLAIPLALDGVTLRSATLDDRPAPLGRSPQGTLQLFVKGKGNHELKLEMIAPLETAAAEQSLRFLLPRPAGTRWRLTLPGNIEIKSGASVIRRDVDETNKVTRFELLPPREQTVLVMSLNNRILLQQRVVLARSVLINELTQAYSKLHATVSLAIPHGAVDRFRFTLPVGFEVAGVSTPLLSRWSIEKGEGESRVLEVLLREATRDSAVIQIVAVNHSQKLEEWSMPQLRPLDVASHVALIGLLAEERLAASAIQPTGLIPVDSTVLNSALPESVVKPEPGAPRLRPLAAYFASQADFELNAKFQRTEAKLEATSNLLFTFSDRQIQLRGGFALKPIAEPLFVAEIQIPSNWQVTNVTQTDGNKLAFELFPGGENIHRLQIRLPQGAPAGQFFNLFVHATTTPNGWLNEWSQTNVTLPSFPVKGTTREIGAVAVQVLDDLVARPDQLTGLTPLDEKEKAEFGLSGTVTSLAYRYESRPHSATLTLERPQARLTARTFNFLRLEPEALWAHYEVIYQIEHARARRLTLRLPASTPEALSIRGLDATVKEFRSEVVGGERRWIVELSEPRLGRVRLAVDFQQSLTSRISNPEKTAVDVATEVILPLVRAEGVAYQSGMVSVEGTMEFDVQVKTDARRVDVGELVDAEYQVGKRLLGAFGFVGEPRVVVADVRRRPEFGLPSALVQRAEIVTAISMHGLSQTAARFQLRTKAPFLEIALPLNSTLWSATVGGQPASPQRDRDRVLISFPSAGVNELRDLQLVYETPIKSWSRWGQITADAPRLLLRDETGTQRAEIPLADLQWHLLFPDGQRLVHSGGSVFLDGGLPIRSPAAVAAKTTMGWLVFPATQLAPSRRGRLTKSYWGDAYAPADPTATRESAPTVKSPEPMAMPQAEFREALGEKAGRGGNEQLQLQIRDGQVTAPPTNLPTPLAPQLALPPLDATQSSTAAQPPPVPDASGKLAKDQFWALQGVRSLPVELAHTGKQVTFRSLGVAPRFQVTLASARSLDFLAAVVAILVGLFGLSKTQESVGYKSRLVIILGALLLGLPMVVGLFADVELTPVFEPAFYVTCALVPWYLFAGFIRWLFGRFRNPTRALAVAVSILFSFLLTTNAAAQPPSALEDLRTLLVPGTPVKTPSDAVIVPYNADDPLGPQNATKVFVPYAEYVKLWNQTHPNEQLAVKPPVVPWAIGGSTYSATLDSRDSLTIRGSVQVEVFAQGSHLIPLPVTAGVLTKVLVDGQPGRLQVIQPIAADAKTSPATAQQAKANPPPAVPTAPIPAVLLSEPGSKKIELELRLKVTQSGGWRRAVGRVPASAANAFDLLVPAAQTEVRLRLANEPSPPTEFETQQDRETIQTALASTGELDLQWRPKIAQRQLDQSLTARSTAVLDIQEDAIRLTWNAELLFPRGSRDTFTLVVPGDFLMERVLGPNVRGWKTTPEGNTLKVDVTLLKPVTNSEKLTLLLSKRTAIGEGMMASFKAPVVSIATVALHQGTLVVRRSPLLEVQVDEVAGLSRADADEQEVQTVLANVTEDSPLGIRPFQTYRFAATPFTLSLSVGPQVAKTTVEVQSLIKIADRENRYEARLNFVIENRPRYSVRCRLPVGLRLDEVVGPAKLEWTTDKTESGEVLIVFLPDGQQQFSVIVRGRLARSAAEAFLVPKLELLDVDRQTGQVVIQADPAFAVRADQLMNCDNVLLEQVHGWLNQDQRRLARLAFSYRSPDFAATLHVSARQARVRAFTITNCRVTPVAVENTVYLQFAITDAGIRTVQFQLPAEMRDARITAPLLRQKTFETIADQPGRIRVKLELQDEVTEQFIILVEHDRGLNSPRYDAPIPVVETGTTEQRFVVLESAGRDEVVVSAADQLTELNRQQSQWQRLTETLGDKITRAYVVREGAASPRLTIQTRQRATVETAGARIGLAKTLLIVDGSGAYRGIQEFHVDNKTEQYLEVVLPAGAELWTARVADEPVKPAAVRGAATGNRFRVPLIKSAAGDLDYIVELKYGGQMRFPSAFGQVAFPLMHTTNIHVERSQVRLRLPETHKWIDFGGTMRRVRDQQDLLTGFMAYKSEQLEQLLDVARNEQDLFSQVRASNNLKQLGLALHSYQRTYQNFGNNELQKEVQNNAQLLQQAEEVFQQQVKAPAQQVDTDNRALLLFKCASQPIARSKNVVTELQANFDADVTTAVTDGGAPAKNSQEFNLKWLEQGKLQSVEILPAEAKKSENRVDFGSRAGDNKSISGKGEATRAANDLGKKVAEDARVIAPKSDVLGIESANPQWARMLGGQRGGEIDEQVQRYQQRLQQQQAGQQPNAPAQPMLPALPGSDRISAGGVPGGMMGGTLQPGAAGMGSGFQVPPPAGPGSGPGQQPVTPAAQAVPSSQVALAGLRSLDVQLPERGVEYLFVTPRGEIAIEARVIETRRWERLVPLLMLLGALAGIGILVRYVRRMRQNSPAVA